MIISGTNLFKTNGLILSTSYALLGQWSTNAFQSLTPTFNLWSHLVYLLPQDDLNLLYSNTWKLPRWFEYKHRLNSFRIIYGIVDLIAITWPDPVVNASILQYTLRICIDQFRVPFRFLRNAALVRDYSQLNFYFYFTIYV